MARPAALEPKRGAKVVWLEGAHEEIENLVREARRTGATFSSDALRERVPPPDHPAWFGAAWSAASNRGLIEPLGWQISTTRSRRGGPVRVWQPKGR